MTPILSIALFLLASLAWGILIAAVLLYLFRPFRVAPTFYHRRRNRDAPERKLFEELKSGMEELEGMREESRLFGCIDCGALKPMNALSWGFCDRCQDKAMRDSQNRNATEVGGIDYKWLGTTGEER